MAEERLSRKQLRDQERLKRLEEGFSSNVKNERVREYNALSDPNMRHFFENRGLQVHLYKAGLIDRQGRVIDYEKNKAKIAIIEQEFKMAEKAEQLRQREEQEMRRRVQLKRQEALEQAKRVERLQKMKEDQRIRREIISATRESQCAGIAKPPLNRRKSPSTLKQSGESFFLTETPTIEEADEEREAELTDRKGQRPETGKSLNSLEEVSNNDALDTLVGETG